MPRGPRSRSPRWTLEDSRLTRATLQNSRFQHWCSRALLQDTRPAAPAWWLWQLVRLHPCLASTCSSSARGTPQDLAGSCRMKSAAACSINSGMSWQQRQGRRRKQAGLPDIKCSFKGLTTACPCSAAFLTT